MGPPEVNEIHRLSALEHWATAAPIMHRNARNIGERKHAHLMRTTPCGLKPTVADLANIKRLANPEVRRRAAASLKQTIARKEVRKRWGFANPVSGAEQIRRAQAMRKRQKP